MFDATLKTEEEDQAQVNAILASTPLPPEIQTVTVELKDNFSGEPSVFLSFKVKQGADLGREPITRLSGFIRGVQDQLLRSGISRFPYAELSEAA